MRFVKQINRSTIQLERIPSNESVDRQTNMEIVKRNADSSNKSIMIPLIRQTNLIDTLAIVKQNNDSSNEFAASKQIRQTNFENRQTSIGIRQTGSKNRQTGFNRQTNLSGIVKRIPLKSNDRSTVRKFV